MDTSSYDKLYCTVDCPCMTGFTVQCQWVGHVFYCIVRNKNDCNDKVFARFGGN